MVRWVRLGELLVLVRSLVVVELAALHDNTTKSVPMSADELSRRLDYEVSTMLNRSEQVRSGESIVHDERQVVAVSNLSYLLDVLDV